jgi:hypothetical protein
LARDIPLFENFRFVMSNNKCLHSLMSSLFRDYVASVRPRGKPFRSRSMVLCLAGHRPVLFLGRNARRQGLKTTFALLCPRSPGLTPRSLHWLLNSGLLNKSHYTRCGIGGRVPRTQQRRVGNHKILRNEERSPVASMPDLTAACA